MSAEAILAEITRLQSIKEGIIRHMPAHHEIPFLFQHDFYVVYQTNLELDRLTVLYKCMKK